MTFDEIANVCANALPSNRAGEKLLQWLTGRASRIWFHACRTWVHGGPGPETFADIKRVLGAMDPFRRSVAELHLDCARKALGESPAERFAPERLHHADFTESLVRDLVKELRSPTPDPQPGIDSVELNLLLVSEERQDDSVGRVIRLRMQLMEPSTTARSMNASVDGTPRLELSRCPALAFLRRDDKWKEAERNALKSVERLGLAGGARIVRWDLVTLDDQELPARVSGNSASLALTVGLGALLSRNVQGAKPSASWMAAPEGPSWQ